MLRDTKAGRAKPLSREISSRVNVVDIRDVIARFEELRDEITDMQERLTEAQTVLEEAPEGSAKTTLDMLRSARDDAQTDCSEWDSQEEHDSLKSLLEHLAGNGGDEQWESDWCPGSLIADSHFEDYTRELAEDIGAINREASWPNNFIDWGEAANALQMDYSSVEWESRTFWYR